MSKKNPPAAGYHQRNCTCKSFSTSNYNFMQEVSSDLWLRVVSVSRTLILKFNISFVLVEDRSLNK